MILDIIMWWGLLGVGLTLFWPRAKTQKEFWITSFLRGPFLWWALGMIYLLRRYGGMEFSFWENENGSS